MGSINIYWGEVRAGLLTRMWNYREFLPAYHRCWNCQLANRRYGFVPISGSYQQLPRQPQ